MVLEVFCLLYCGKSESLMSYYLGCVGIGYVCYVICGKDD